MSRRSRNIIRVIRALVICIIVVLAIAAAGYAIGTRIFGDKGIVYINADYSEGEPAPAENVLDRSSDEQTADADVMEIMELMTLHEKVSQLFVSSPEALTGVGTVVQAGASTQSSLENYPLGGLVYAQKNFESDEQTKTMMENVQRYALERIGVRLLIAVLGEDGASLKIGEDNQNTSIQVTYFPVNSSSDEEIAAMSEEDILNGYLDSLKSQLNGRTKIVIARNLVVRGVDDSAASVSEDWIWDILRDKLGYGGVVMTEDLGELSRSAGKGVSVLAVSAIQAGADLIYTGTDLQSSIQAVEEAVEAGTVTEERIEQSLLRVLTLKAEYGMLDLTAKTYEGSGEAAGAGQTASGNTSKTGTSSGSDVGENTASGGSTDGVVDDSTSGNGGSGTGSTGIEGVVDDPSDSGGDGNR